MKDLLVDERRSKNGNSGLDEAVEQSEEEDQQSEADSSH